MYTSWSPKGDSARVGPNRFTTLWSSGSATVNRETAGLAAGRSQPQRASSAASTSSTIRTIVRGFHSLTGAAIVSPGGRG